MQCPLLPPADEMIELRVLVLLPPTVLELGWKVLVLPEVIPGCIMLFGAVGVGQKVEYCMFRGPV